MYNIKESSDLNYGQMKKHLIHPWEKSMRVVNVIITLIAIISSLGFIAYMVINPDSINDESIQGGFAVFGLFIMIIIQLGRQYGKSRANSVQLGRDQFPEIYEIVEDFSKRLDMGYVPEVYLTQQGGVLNAFATSFFSRKFISINSAIFELAYLEHKDVDTLAFVIGHELTHLKRKHSTTGMMLLEMIPSLIPVWGMAVSRVKEYTCDRHALWLAPLGGEGLILLATGKHMYKHVNIENYIKTSQNYKGFFFWLYNLLASHPAGPKRIKAIHDTSSWGKVF